MASLDGFPNLMSVARRSGDKGVRDIVEIMNKTNDALEDIPWIECNSGVNHITTMRTDIPTPTWRMLNSGVPVTKSETAQITAGCGMLEDYAKVDKKLVDLAVKNGGEDAAPDFMRTESVAHIEGFGQEIARVMFYGDPANPKEPVGLTHYYNDLDAPNRRNLINAGGTNNANTSIWMICWGDRTLHGIYPQGSKAGISERFLGEETFQDVNGNEFQGYRTHYSWDAGFVVRDWRAAVRICNIDSEKVLDGVGLADLMTLMTRATHRVPKRIFNSTGRVAFYCRPEVLEALDVQARATNNLRLTYADVDGKEILRFRGIPIREQESLLDSEANVE